VLKNLKTLKRLYGNENEIGYGSKRYASFLKEEQEVKNDS